MQTWCCWITFNINTPKILEKKAISSITIRITTTNTTIVSIIKIFKSIAVFIFCAFIGIVFDLNSCQSISMYYLSNNALYISHSINKTMFEASIGSMIYTFGFVFVVNCIFSKKYNYYASNMLMNCIFNLFDYIIRKIKIFSNFDNLQ